MAKYNKDTRFYWLQLKEDFFEEDAIDWLEEQPNGTKYSLFYLKLCLKSLKTNGVLIRKVGQMLVPYDHVKLGELTKTDPDTVMVAMQLLTNIGLVKVLENGELYLTQVEGMIGSQSLGAFKKQQQRMAGKSALLLDSGQEVDKCPPNIEKEKEEDLKIDLEQEEETKEDKEPKKGKKGASASSSSYDALINETSWSDAVKDIIYEFIKMRKLIKKPMTDYALKKMLNKLERISNGSEETAIAILDKSITNNWQDIFEPKVDTPKKASAPANSGNIFLDIAEEEGIF